MTAPKLCECGCGQPAPLARMTDRRSGVVKGQPSRYIRGHNPSGRPQAHLHPAKIRRPTTPTERYLEDLLHRSKLIVGALRDTGPDELLRQIDLALAMEQPPGVDPAVALVTVLAAQIDPDTTDEQRLSWVRAFDPLEPPGPLPVRASPRKETAA